MICILLSFQWGRLSWELGTDWILPSPKSSNNYGKNFKIVIYSKIFKPIQTVSCSGVDTAIFRGTLIIINQLVSQAIVNCDMILF